MILEQGRVQSIGKVFTAETQVARHTDAEKRGGYGGINRR